MLSPGMDLAFLIDHRKCIGCHACTVACKAENDVPVGEFRTWVKYVEKGVYPDTRRHFTVLRCNHCDAAPCVTICPVNALQKRPDRIVDLDRDACIGCRACMQACPYDALYLNEDTGTAEKCHFCAHRTELGLEPACVVVCPERAIVAGDTSNPESTISKMIEELPTVRRKVEKGTEPRVHYVDAAPEGLDGAATAQPRTWLWSDRKAPPAFDGPVTPGEATTVLNADHPPVWGAHVWVYVVTKNLAAGIMLLAPILARLGVAPAVADGPLPELLSLFFLALTTVLLVSDLGRPERFLRLLLRPNPRSWLVRGAWVLTGFGAVVAASAAARIAGVGAAAFWLRIAALPLALLTAGYTAWLFAQCRGRDLWSEDGLFVHLCLRALLLGAGAAAVLPHGPAGGGTASRVFLLLLVANAAWIGINRWIPYPTREGQLAHDHLWRSGEPQVAILLTGLAAAMVVPAAAGLAAAPAAGIGLALAVLAEFFYEKAWIRSGQAVPLS